MHTNLYHHQAAVAPLINSDIAFLRPDMPTAKELEPYLAQIDHHQYYSNFGPLLKRFEQRLTEYLSTFAAAGNFLTTTSSGTDGLECALRALDLAPGAKVLIPAYTFIATGIAVLKAGYTPVFADVDETLWALTPKLAREYCLMDRIEAIMPVASYGLPLDIDAWDTFTADTGIPVIIDAAGALGNQALGLTTTVVFSMHATKLFGIGEGGLICSPNETFIQNARSLTNFAVTDHGIHRLGSNAKLSEYHAAVGLAQLDRWSVKYAKHLAIRQQYLALLDDVPNIACQYHCDHYASSLLPVRCLTMEAEEVLQQLAERQIPCRRYYTPIVSEEPLFKEFAGELLPVTTELAESVICLPFHGELSTAEMTAITRSLAQITQSEIAPARG